jgi:4-hydroxy-tetrahydrodipicolinate reductase
VSSPILAVGVHGAAGRMGRRLIQLIGEDPALELTAAIERHGHPQLGEDAGSLAGGSPLGVKLAHALPPGARTDVVVDFSVPDASLKIAGDCKERGIPLVVGTTGFAPSERERLESISSSIALLISPNMSRAVNLLLKLANEAAQALGATCDIAIVEQHHRTKKDAPSGTALRLAEYVGRGRARAAEPSGALARSIEPGALSIDIHALRVGDSAGEHTVIFGMAGETLELTHRASNRDGFARGALDAARFLSGKPAGLYSMEDVLASIH